MQFFHNLLLHLGTLQKNFHKSHDKLTNVRKHFMNVRKQLVNVHLHITLQQIFNSVHKQNIT